MTKATGIDRGKHKGTTMNNQLAAHSVARWLAAASMQSSKGAV